jgi:O-acetyl-ADP-ribose deacetylase
MRKAQFKIGGSVLELSQGDITKQETDAIVNPANSKLSPGGGVAGAIHREAGPKLWEECENLGGCRTGEAKITNAYNLRSRYIIHTVGPVYGNRKTDPINLRDSYYNSLKLAEEKGVKSISFPAISTGAFNYPMEKAAEIALKTIIDYLKKGSKIELVRMVLFYQEDLNVFKKVLKELL